MFRFRPNQLFFDPWSREYVHVPEELFYAEPYRQPTYDVFSLPDYPSFRSEDVHDLNIRPCSQGARHPLPAAHAFQQRHPFYHHPQAEYVLRRPHPARSYANAKAAAAHAQPEHADDALLDRDTTAPWPAVADRPYAAHRSMSPSSCASAQDRYMVYPVSQPPGSVHAAVRAVQPSPFSTAQQTVGQQPPSPAAVVATNRGRHTIPVHAVSSAGHSTAAEQVASYSTVHQSAPAARHAQQRSRQQQQQPQKVWRTLSRSEAATLIQSWWRMRRLARQRSALKALAAAAAQLRSTSQLFLKYKEDSSSPAVNPNNQQQAVFHGLSHKQYLELNELAMRVLLQLDATSCGVTELRAVRKRLTASAIKLLDEIQAAYSAAVNASMELPDDVVRAAVQSMAQVAPGSSAAAALAGAAAEAEHSDNQQQQWQQQVPDNAEAAQVGEAQQQQQQHPQHNKQEVVACLSALEEPAGAQLATLEQQQRQDSPLTNAGLECHAVTTSTDSSQGFGDQGQLVKAEVSDLQQQLAQPLQQVQESVRPAGVRVVLVYPGSRADAATQTVM